MASRCRPPGTDGTAWPGRSSCPARTARSGRSSPRRRSRRRAPPGWCTARAGQASVRAAEERVGGGVASNVENAMTQPSCVLDVQAGMFLKSPPTSLAVLDGHVAAEQDRRDQPLAQRGLRVDLAWRAAARSTNEPCEWPISTIPRPWLYLRRYVVRGVCARRRSAICGRCGVGPPGCSSAVQRDLAVHRRVDAAVLRVARRLVERDRALLGVDVQVCVASSAGRTLLGRRRSSRPCGVRESSGSSPRASRRLVRSAWS